MDKTLIIFEFKDEIESFIAQRSLADLKTNNIIILAIQPEAQVYLKQLNISFFNTNDLFGKEGHEQVLLQSDRIFNFWEPFLTIEDDLGIKEGYRNFFLLSMRLYAHYLLGLIEVIEKACIWWDVKKIISFKRDNRHITEPFLSDTEGYAEEIGARVARKLNIEFKSFHVLKEKGTKNLLFIKLKKNAAEIIKFFIYQIKVHLLARLIRNKKIILATSRAYNLGRVLDRFKQTFDNVHTLCINSSKRKYLQELLALIFSIEVIQLPAICIFRKRKYFQKNQSSLISEIEKSKKGEEIFIYRGISFKDLIFKRIREDTIPSLCEIYSKTIYLDNLLRKFRPTIIISQMARGVNYNLGELASLYNIPSILISHGSHVPPKNEYEMIEWKEHGLGLINTHYRYIALQSPWARAYIDKIPIKSEGIITGPILFVDIKPYENDRKALRKKIIPRHSDKIILLHADTPKQRMGMRLYVYQTVDEYIFNINSLIKAVEQINNYHLIIRFRPQSYLSQKSIIPLLLKSDCYTVCSDGTFDEYLAIADMLVSYSSTTIEEALQNKIPVLQYDSHGKYSHIPGQKLDPTLTPKIDSCYYVDSEDRLKWSLDWLVENHFSKPIPDSVWERHTFNDAEKETLPVYFKGLFHKQKN